VEESDLKKLPLSVGWYYRINRKGKGCKLSFPIRPVSRVYMRKKYVVSSEKLVIESHIPMGKLIHKMLSSDLGLPTYVFAIFVIFVILFLISNYLPLKQHPTS
jgi:hypothetical protein